MSITEEEILPDDPSYFELRLWHSARGTHRQGLYRKHLVPIMGFVFSSGLEQFFQVPFDAVRTMFELYFRPFDFTEYRATSYPFMEGIYPRAIKPTCVAAAGDDYVAIVDGSSERLLLGSLDVTKDTILVHQGLPFNGVDSCCQVDACTLAVSCTKSDQVFMIEMKKNGKILRTLGGYGTGLGMLRGPRGMCMTDDNQLMVCDSSNHRIQFFDPLTGQGLREIGKGFKFPARICQVENGKIAVSFGKDPSIVILTQGGVFINQITLEATAIDSGLTAVHVDMIAVSHGGFLSVYTWADGSLVRRVSCGANGKTLCCLGSMLVGVDIHGQLLVLRSS